MQTLVPVLRLGQYLASPKQVQLCKETGQSEEWSGVSLEIKISVVPFEGFKIPYVQQLQHDILMSYIWHNTMVLRKRCYWKRSNVR